MHYLEFPMLQHKQTVSYHNMGFYVMMCHMLQVYTVAMLLVRWFSYSVTKVVLI